MFLQIILYLIDARESVWFYFSFQPVLHNWCNNRPWYVLSSCGMMHIKEPLLLIGKRSPCGGSRFHLSLSEWSFTICLMPYNHKNVLSASLNKTFPFFIHSDLHEQCHHCPAATGFHNILTFLWWAVHFRRVFHFLFSVDDSLEPWLLSDPKYSGHWVASGECMNEQIITDCFSKCLLKDLDVINIWFYLVQAEREFSTTVVVDLKADFVTAAFVISTSASPSAW